MQHSNFIRAGCLGQPVVDRDDQVVMLGPGIVIVGTAASYLPCLVLELQQRLLGAADT